MMMMEVISNSHHSDNMAQKIFSTQHVIEKKEETNKIR